jgi:hypothetical protein
MSDIRLTNYTDSSQPLQAQWFEEEIRLERGVFVDNLFFPKISCVLFYAAIPLACWVKGPRMCSLPFPPSGEPYIINRHVCMCRFYIPDNNSPVVCF